MHSVSKEQVMQHNKVNELEEDKTHRSNTECSPEESNVRQPISQ